MNVGGKHYRSIWREADGRVRIIDQTKLPHHFEILELKSLEDSAHAIETMQVRGAPCIGATAAYGVALALQEGIDLDTAIERLARTRPTAVNLHWALDEMREGGDSLNAAWSRAAKICDDDVEICRAIGEHGLEIIEAHAAKKTPVNILTHCNAGWIATVDWGTALAPIYMAHNNGLDVHVWVDETRPRNQGAALTAWELGAHGVAHTIITDNAGGHLMQRGQVDLCIVGTDRTTRCGDVANKIGTYLKALAAHDNHVPFYVALPYTTIDWNLRHGRDIPIEERGAEEVTHLLGRTARGTIETVHVSAPGSRVANFAFDVTPARLVTGLITERGVTQASEEGLLKLYPERA